MALEEPEVRVAIGFSPGSCIPSARQANLHDVQAGRARGWSARKAGQHMVWRDRLVRVDCVEVEGSDEPCQTRASSAVPRAGTLPKRRPRGRAARIAASAAVGKGPGLGEAMGAGEVDGEGPAIERRPGLRPPRLRPGRLRDLRSGRPGSLPG